MPPEPPRSRRALILTAAVGDGHLAAARALAEDFELVHPEVDVTVADVLVVFGPVLRFLLCDAYRVQLRRAPWIFGVLFLGFLRIRPLRTLGRLGLAALGARRLARFIRAHGADIVISTYPAATSVLGYLRRRGRVQATACATITDLGAVCFWAHPGIDLHLVMHERLVVEVEREAGAGSAQVTRPLVARAFFQPADGAGLRRGFGIPDGAKLVVVSGGGWGVGDLAGATREALTVSDAYVITIAGRNQALERDLRSAFGGDARVRVLGFTSRMSDLLAGADVLVHSTGGVTCLEALARGCPVVSYGALPGHVPTVSHAMHALGVATHAQSRSELRRALGDALAAGVNGAASEIGSLSSPASTVLNARSRLPARPTRRRARRAMVVLAAAVAGAVFATSSGRAYALFADQLDLAPTSTIGTAAPEVGLIVEAPAAMLPSLAHTIARTGGSATFAFSAAPSTLTQRILQLHGDTLIPSLTRSRFLGWVTTADHLQDAKASVRAIRVAYCLAPSTGVSAGQYFLARATGVTVIDASVNLNAASTMPATIKRGAIAVLRIGADRPDTRLLLQLLAELHRERLRASALPLTLQNE